MRKRVADAVLIPSSSGLKAGRLSWTKNEAAVSLNPFFIRSQGRTQWGGDY